MSSVHLRSLNLENSSIVIWQLALFRAAMTGKATEAQVLPGFCRIESGDGRQLMWPPLWQPCLPKIGCGGPVVDDKSMTFFSILICATKLKKLTGKCLLLQYNTSCSQKFTSQYCLDRLARCQVSQRKKDNFS